MIYRIQCISKSMVMKTPKNQGFSAPRRMGLLSLQQDKKYISSDKVYTYNIFIDCGSPCGQIEYIKTVTQS